MKLSKELQGVMAFPFFFFILILCSSPTPFCPVVGEFRVVDGRTQMVHGGSGLYGTEQKVV